MPRQLERADSGSVNEDDYGGTRSPSYFSTLLTVEPTADHAQSLVFAIEVGHPRFLEGNRRVVSFLDVDLVRSC